MPSRFDVSREQLIKILASLPEVVTIVDDDLTIQFMNRPGVEGYTLAEMRDVPALEFVAPDQREEQRAMLRSVLETGEEQTFEAPITTSEGEVAWYEGRMSPIREDGEVVAVLMVSRNVTARRRAEEEVEDLRRLVPICSWCGKVRSDEGYWSTVESYIEEQEDARVTHGMCSDCEGDVGRNGTEDG